MNDEQFWERFDIIKMRLFKYVYKEFWKIDWTKPQCGIKQADSIYENLLKKWDEIERDLVVQGIKAGEIRRYKGALFEALFYYACLQIDLYFKLCWSLIFELASTIEELRAKGQSSKENLLKEIGPEIARSPPPPSFGVLPLSDFVPPILHIPVKGKRLKFWHLQADFVIYTGEIEKRILPSVFVDVKSSKPRLDEKRDAFKDQATACKFFDSEMVVVYPKNHLPRKPNEWDIKLVCPYCGSLEEPMSKDCSNCKSEIHLPLFLCRSCGYEFKTERIIPLRLTCPKCRSESVCHLSAVPSLAYLLREVDWDLSALYKIS
jgi:hypothetical protein